MKRITYFLIILIGLTSCEKKLDLKPTSQLTFQGFWDSEDGARAAQTGLHARFRSYAYTLWQLGEVRSDIWGGKTVESPADETLIQQTISATQVPFTNWANFYGFIHNLNDFIYNVPNITFNDENEKNYMLGQAYGIRAYIYYTMLKTWGKVPITIEPLLNIDPSNTGKARSSESDVMAQIKDDIEQSLSHFGDDYSFQNNKRIYWSKAATLTLKGDVYIWSGTHLGGGSADYTAAKQALLDLQQNADVGLLDNYADIFKASNKNNKEIIFAFNYEQDQATNFYSLFTGRGTEINPLFDEEGNSMSTYITNGANRYGPTDHTLTVLDDTLDSRRNATFMRLYNDGSGYPTYNADHYVTSILTKFSGIIESGQRIEVDDVPVYRYADALLLLAEAKNLLGEDPSEQINQIRKRAYGSNYDPAVNAYQNGTKDQNIAAILNERLKEFIGEGKRWWDLRRAGDSWVINNNDYLAAGQEYKLVLPITTDMIGRNPQLEQTAGY
jgi:hypothetical protein